MALSAAMASTWPCCQSTMQSVVRATPTGLTPLTLDTFASVVDPLVAQTFSPFFPAPASDVTLSSLRDEELQVGDVVRPGEGDLAPALAVHGHRAGDEVHPALGHAVLEQGHAITRRDGLEPQVLRR